MLIALNVVLAAAVVAGMVALFVHAIRSEHRDHQLQAEAARRTAQARTAQPGIAQPRTAQRRAAQRRTVERHLAAGRPASSWRREGDFSASRG